MVVSEKREFASYRRVDNECTKDNNKIGKSRHGCKGELSSLHRQVR